MKQKILSYLPGDHPWQNTLYYYDTLPSTNDLAKEMAQNNAPNGTVIIAGSQSAGRGRMGRSFFAPAGKGVYLSVILRPDCHASELMHLTCAAAVAACQAVETATGITPAIKWTNDLVVCNQKVGGILTELSIDSKTGLVNWAIIGIGMNCCHQKADFPEDIRTIATSLQLQSANTVAPSSVAAALIESLYHVNCGLLSNKENILAAYRQKCMTLQKQIVIVRGGEKRYGTALDIDSNGGLIVEFDDGVTDTVQSGEVSVRGLYGYV